MNKLKKIFVTLTIIVLTAIWYTGMAVAAQVSWVNESKGRVHINGGVDEGYIVGATVCFIVDFESGEKLVCGMVHSAEASSAVVKVDKNGAKRMKKGTEALLYVEKKDKQDKEEIKDTREKETVEESAPSPSMRIHDQKGY
jgi:predicted Mrr-cat superfamily restriction endonuclease